LFPFRIYDFFCNFASLFFGYVLLISLFLYLFFAQKLAPSPSLCAGPDKYSLLIGWKRINLSQIVSIDEKLNFIVSVTFEQWSRIKLPGFPSLDNKKLQKEVNKKVDTHQEIR